MSALNDIFEEYDFLDADDRYRLLIDLGKESYSSKMSFRALMSRPAYGGRAQISIPAAIASSFFTRSFRSATSIRDVADGTGASLP